MQRPTNGQRLTPSGPQQVRPRLEEILRRIQADPPQSSQAAVSVAPPTRCPECLGAGYLQVVDNKDRPVYEPGGSPRLLRCNCQSGGDEARLAAKLQAVDGLTDAERLIRFDQLVVTAANRGAHEAARAAVEHARGPRGFLVFSGTPGVGKTTLSICAVNSARVRGYAGVYETGEGLLRYLRAAFDPAADRTFDERWRLLVGATVLVLDELTLDNTPWAVRQLEELIDARWRRLSDMLTIVCTNQAITGFTPRVASRLGDANVTRPNLGTIDFRKWRVSP